MRLLERRPDGNLVFRESTDNDLLAYAILSHTWLINNNEEVSFQDVEAGTGKSKAGWRKIQFCADKAAADGLRYFWIDTCCIDKKNSTELYKAVNSMFRWYQNAARCYVYLSDVSVQDGKALLQQGICHWEAAYRKSRWFTLGWTLQELLAPTSVDFFSSEGEKLGSKVSLEGIIHDITGIPRIALRGKPLGDFSRNERMSWASNRHTREAEDEAYSLIGIFDVSMPLIYGEGKEKAHKRLLEEIDKTYRGYDSDQFAVRFDVSAIPEAVQFVARENELAEMGRLLYGRKSRSSVVLHGLGGIGKTQLVIEYVRRYKEKYTAIFWVNAKDEDTIKLSFRDIAKYILEQQMGRSSTSTLTSLDLNGNLDQVITAVKTWLNLQRNTGWLMIYDNYDNPRIAGNRDRSAVDIRKFLPRGDHGSIIITTRSAQVSQGRRIHIQKLQNIHDGLEILSNTSKRENIENDCGAVALFKELDGLPLALSAAGAYLEHITFDRIEQQNAASAKLLKWWAYFDRQDVWLELLRHAKSSGDEGIQNLTEDELNFNEAVALLCSFGLVSADRSVQQQSGTGGYSVHSCVHSWTVSVLNKEWDGELARLALTCVALEVPSTNEKDRWLLQRRLLPHALRQDVFIAEGKVDVGELDWAFYNLGIIYFDQGKLAEAEKMYIRALQSYEEACGPDHTSTLDTVNNLGLLYADQGKLGKAERMYIRALKGYEEVLGPDHISTLDTVNNLGNLYAYQGKLAKAEKMCIRALQGKEKTLGPDHISTLDTVNNLGNLYVYQGELAEAEKMYIRALQGKERALGPDHISTLSMVNNLGNLYKNRGKRAEAEKMYIRALQGKEKARGPDHTSTLDTVHNLGLLYADQGELAEAEKMYSRALQGYEAALGVELMRSYMPALNTMIAFGDLYSRTDRRNMARVMYTRALSGYIAIQGPSSEWCGKIKHRLQALQLPSAEPETLDEQNGTGKPGTRSRPRRDFRKPRT
ncbi:Tetratricopeptide repeat-containing protein [Cladophialophora immunda]|nr:Tetratricopeptide repeat-containing protein [Cladophialophora immunda]